MRNLFNTKSAPAFTMGDREKSAAAGQNSDYTALTSLPMYSKYANVDSVKETSFERLMILMKDPLDSQSVKAFLKDLRQSISADTDSSINIYNYVDSMDSLGKI
jgi:hypothetical protein